MFSVAAKGEERGNDVSVTVAIIVLFLFSLGVGVFLFAFPLSVFHNNFTGGWLGLVFSGYFLSRLVLAPLAGTLADRYGSKLPLLFALWFAAVLPLGYFVIPGTLTLFCIQLGLGISSGVVKPVLLAYLSSASPREKQGRAFGWAGSAANLVFFLGPAVGGLLYYFLRMELVLTFMLGCMGISAMLIHFFAPTAFYFERKEETRSHAQVSSSTPLLFAVFGRTLGVSVLLVFFPILLSEVLAGPDWLIGLLVSLPGGISCLLLPVTGQLADRVSQKMLIIFGMLISAGALLIVGYCSSPAAFAATGIVMGIGTALSLPSSMARATEGQWARGMAMGLFQMAASSGFLAGPVLSGFLVQWTASAATGTFFAGTIGALTCVPLAIVFFMERYSDSALQENEGLFSAVVKKGVGQGTKTTRSVLKKQKNLIIVLSVSCGLALSFFCLFPGKPFRQTQIHPVANEKLQTFANLAMGGIVHLKMVGADEQLADKAAADAFAAMGRLERDFSHRSSTGSLGRVNRAAGEMPVEVSSEAFALIDRALVFGARSGGVFDITIGAVTVLPLYYRKQASLDKAALVDYRKVVLEPAQQTVFLPESGMALDLGGLAKGSIVDAAAAVMKEAGVPSALVEANGDFFCYGERVWRVGIQDPRSDKLLGIVEVQNAGVCGSGDYYQYDPSSSDSESGRRHHILDAKELTSSHTSIAVTVIAPTTELADALATTLFIMGPDKGQEFLETYPECSALWVLPNQKIIASAGFPPLISVEK